MTSTIPIIGIGASAGGLDALKSFFQGVPDDLGVAYVVIVHLAPDHESELPAILARETSMPVVQVGDHAQKELQPDHVYVIAPDRKLEITDTSVGASRFEQPRGQRTAIDLFFRSLSATHGDIFAIVLSGGGSDGAAGAMAVKQAGGLVLVQDPKEAAHDSMPRSVIATGAADIVLPMRELPSRLAELVRNRGRVRELIAATPSDRQTAEDDEAALHQVLDLLRRRTGHDFAKYKRSTILRRLVRRIQIAHCRTISEYLDYLEQNVEEIQSLFNDLLITVTTFFRDPDAWAALQQQVIAPLVRSADPDTPIRCWVPGCASGEEAYTLAILFAEEMERHGIRQEFIIFASDVDERALATARDGVYPVSISADVSPERLKRWFRRTDDHYRVVAELRDRLVFATHSLQRDPPFSRLHLLSCRNLLIYLDRELQDQVMAIFRYACRDDGYLFLGTSETADAELFRARDKQHRIYQAIEIPEGRRRPLPELPTGILQRLPRHEREGPRQHRDSAAEAHRLALEEQAPPSILVDENWNAIHLSESVGRFLQPRGGPASHALAELVRDELRGELSVALRHAFETREPWLSEFVAVRFNGTPRRVAVLALPRAPEEHRPARALVVFLDTGPVATGAESAEQGQPGNDRERSLLEKLHQAEQQIRHLRAEHHAAEEDLRAVNEELQSLNEEYRSTTEELETSKEELQSINEELQTVNLELKTKLEEVSRGHDDLENLMAATDIATLFVDRNLCIKRFTPQFASIFKVKSHDRGRPIGDITHSLEYAGLEDDARRVLTDLAPIEREVTSLDGRSFVIRLRPYRTAEDKIDGVVVTLFDVSNIKRTEKVLRDSEERFRALVDATAQMVWTTDAEGAMVDSPAWQAFTGQSRQEWQGWGWLDAVHPEERALAERKWRQAIDEKALLDNEFRLYHAASGGYRWTSVRAVPLWNDDGSMRGWVGMNADITERKEAEAALRAADRHKEEFLAMLGHELRNPLAAIRNSVEIFRSGAEPDSGTHDAGIIRQALAIIDRQSQHMTRLVDDLLDVTRITRNTLQLQRKPIDVRQCVDDVIAAMRPEFDTAGLQIRFDPPEQALAVDADPERLVQMLDNLLRNAINFSDPGGIVTVTAGRHGDGARITVRDTGIGMAPEQIEHLFEPYRQAASDGRRGGLGLGLTLVKRLAELHGGSVAASSEGLGKGSAFRIDLPLAQQEPLEKPVLQRRPPPHRRVLVVDDEVDVADPFAMLLETLGQDVKVAYSGARALEVALAQRPQVAFLDLSMPGMSGAELAQRLRGHFPPGELTLVALSGHDAKAGIAQGAEFDHHLLKPASAGAVRDLLDAITVAGGPGSE